jgi:hypothetical protein
MFLKPNGSNQEDAAAIEHVGGLFSYAMILTHNPTEAEAHVAVLLIMLLLVTACPQGKSTLHYVA